MTSTPNAPGRVIYKWPLAAPVAELPWTDGSRVVLVAAQRPHDDWPTIWIEYAADPFASHVRMRRFEVVGTGHGAALDAAHVGSAVCARGALVWHVYAAAVTHLPGGSNASA